VPPTFCLERQSVPPTFCPERQSVPPTFCPESIPIGATHLLPGLLACSRVNGRDPLGSHGRDFIPIGATHLLPGLAFQSVPPTFCPDC
jgi:hypothetical protein